MNYETPSKAYVLENLAQAGEPSGTKTQQGFMSVFQNMCRERGS